MSNGLNEHREATGNKSKEGEKEKWGGREARRAVRGKRPGEGMAQLRLSKEKMRAAVPSED